MSGSFWKFGQDYTTTSPLIKILNRSFLKIESEDEIEANKNSDKSHKSVAGDKKVIDGSDSSSDIPDIDEDDEESSDCDALPDSEAGFKYYKPNLNVLDDLLDDEELYTELMCSNFKLLVYLKYPEVLGKLIDYIIRDNDSLNTEDNTVRDDSATNTDNDDDTMNIKEDNNDKNSEDVGEDNEENAFKESSLTLSPDIDESNDSRRAHMAAEILSADVWPISSSIMENKYLLEKLWSVTNSPGSLSIETSTYFMKINERLLDMDIDGMTDFILSQDNIVDRFLAHIDDPPLIDFLLKVISTDKADVQNGVIKLLKSQDLIPKLIDLLTPENDTGIQSAVADFLKALLAISGNCTDELASSIGPNELTRQLTSPEIIEKLIKTMLHGGSPLSNGVGIIIELIRKNNSDYDYIQVMHTTLESHPPNDRDPIYLGHMIKLFAQYMPQFNSILVESSTPILDTSFGRIEPLGFERFKICELVAELLHCSNMALLNEPKGELIIKERDLQRIKLAEQQDFPMDTIMESEKGVAEKLNSLQLASSQPSSPSTIEDKIENNNNINDDPATFPDNISDSIETEKLLAKRGVIGDKLKIALFETQIITTILEMFFHFSWNNFLHNVVFDIIQQIFNGPLKTGYNKFLLKDLLETAELTKLIIDGDKECSRQEEEANLRLGYMGHLTLIAEELVKFAAYLEEMKISFTTGTIENCLKEPKWMEYVETTLAETRAKYDQVLGDIPDADEDSNILYDNDDDDDNSEQMLFDRDLDDNEDQDASLYKDRIDDYTDAFSSTANLMDNDEDEDYAEYSDRASERYYEYVDEEGTRTVLYDSSMEYHDTDETKQQGEDDDDEGEGEEDYDVEGDSNRFTKYMSDELGKSYQNGTHLVSSHAEEECDFHDEKGGSWDVDSSFFVLNNFQKRSLPATPELHDEDIFQHQFELEGLENDDDDDDNYMDPNDDGQSYAKPDSSLYGDMIKKSSYNSQSKTAYFSKALSQDDDDDISDDSDAELEIELDDDKKFNEQDSDEYGPYTLCRSRSKDNINWKDDSV